MLTGWQVYYIPLSSLYLLSALTYRPLRDTSELQLSLQLALTMGSLPRPCYVWRSAACSQGLVVDCQSYNPHDLVTASMCLPRTRGSKFLADMFANCFRRQRDGDLYTMMGCLDGVFFGHNLRDHYYITLESKHIDPERLGYCAPRPHSHMEIYINPRQTKIELTYTLIHEMAHAYLTGFTCPCSHCNQSSPHNVGPTGHGKAWQALSEFMLEEVRTWHRELRALPCYTHQYDTDCLVVDNPFRTFSS